MICSLFLASSSCVSSSLAESFSDIFSSYHIRNAVSVSSLPSVSPFSWFPPLSLSRPGRGSQRLDPGKIPKQTVRCFQLKDIDTHAGQVRQEGPSSSYPTRAKKRIPLVDISPINKTRKRLITEVKKDKRKDSETCGLFGEPGVV